MFSQKWIVVFALALGLRVFSTPAVAQSGGVDTRFSAGAIISRDGDEFSRVDPYLALDIEPNFSRWKSNRLFLTGLANIRMTAIPVDTQAVDSSGTPLKVQPTGGEGVPVPLPGGDTKAFLKSKKAAGVVVGGYLGYSLQELSPTLERTFIGPIFKFGFQSVTQKEQQARLWKPADTLFDQEAVGVRFGLFEKLGLDENSQVETIPRIKAYLDIMAGKFQNFEIATYRGPLEKDGSIPAAAKPSDFKVRQDWRLKMEGRLTLVDRLYVGLDLNNGRGRDDMRFLLGITFDAKDWEKLWDGIKPQHTSP